MQKRWIAVVTLSFQVLFIITPTSHTSIQQNSLTDNAVADSVAYQQPVIEAGDVASSTPITEYQFPQTSSTPLPDTLMPTADVAANDMPKPYGDKCHVQQNLTATKSSCIYANAASKTTIVLFGDSHALSWFPAIEQLAINKNWKLVSLTMSSCWPSTIPAWNATTNVLMSNCAIWRANALKQIATIKPYITFVAGTRGFSTIDKKGNILDGTAKTNAWIAGMNTTLAALHKATKNLVYLSDYPTSQLVVPDCLNDQPYALEVCATPVDTAISVDWLNTERIVALSNKAIWVNPTEWVCNTDPCLPVLNNYVIYRDGGHLTATFAQTLEAPLWQALAPVIH
jgi:hypothetical protein